MDFGFMDCPLLSSAGLGLGDGEFSNSNPDNGKMGGNGGKCGGNGGEIVGKL